MSTDTTAKTPADLAAERLAAAEAEVARLREEAEARARAQEARHAAAVAEWQARTLEEYPRYAAHCEEVLRELRDAAEEAGREGNICAAVAAAQEVSAVGSAQEKAWVLYSDAFDVLFPRPDGMVYDLEERSRVEALPAKLGRPAGGWFDLTSVLERVNASAGSEAARRGEARFEADVEARPLLEDFAAEE